MKEETRIRKRFEDAADFKDGKETTSQGIRVHGVAKSWTQLSDFTFTFHFHALEEEMATHSSVLAWRLLVGCCLWGCTESDTTEAT